MASPKSKPSILSCFSGMPRQGQSSILKQVEILWDKADVFVIGAPVAFGKTRMAHAIASWAWQNRGAKSTILTPTNLLVEQYIKEFPRLHSLQRMDSYTCATSRDGYDRVSCQGHKEQMDFFCDGCPYIRARQKAFVFPYKVVNMYTALAYRLHSELMIFDEAHNIKEFLREQNGKKLWAAHYGIPSWARTYGKLLDWAKRHPRAAQDKKLQILIDELENGKQNFLMSRGPELYRGREEDCISLLPLRIRDSKPILWPEKKVKKIVLMSATMSPTEIHGLGLDGRRVVYLDGESPIKPARRPLVYMPVCKVNFSNMAESASLLSIALKELADFHAGQKGIVHAPYGFAELLSESALGQDPRFIFHDKEGKAGAYALFRTSEKPLILIASGMHEGIDLPYEAAGWQAICKVPYPSLADPAVKFHAEQNPESYAWETVKIMAQAYGRVCRTPDDYGATYILDEAFENLYRRWEPLFPKFFREAYEYTQSVSNG